MSQNLIEILTKCLVDTLIALEFSEESQLGEDTVIQIIEQIGHELQSLPNADKELLIEKLNKLSKTYPDQLREFIVLLPENLGL
jgi:hypothetical protein